MNTSAERTRADERSLVRSPRSQAPVFVLGCPRSGTTVLYHMLLSAGDFAVYRTESNVFNLLVPRFGGMQTTAQRQELMDVWLRSKLFRVSGLDPSHITARIVAECHGGGDFLRILMEEIAGKQGMRRWADCTPEHLLSMAEIKRQIPEALFIHIIRDGRDVALSYAKQGWSYPLPWDGEDRLGVSGLYWEWIVRKGREQGRHLGPDYQEVSFEELISNPQAILSRLGTFIDHDLDYDRIQQVGIGSVREPNSSFTGETEGKFDPVARWKMKMSAEELGGLEELIGNFLGEAGYDRVSQASKQATLRAARMRATYFAIFEAKQWMRENTALGRFVRLERLEIEPRNLF